MRQNHLAAAAKETIVLTLILSGTAATTLVFQHAALGMPLLFRNYQFAYAAAVKSPLAGSEDWQKTSGAPEPLKSQALPSHVFLKVPFTTQAPLGDWSDPYGESCEEASVLMAVAWARGDQPGGGLIPPRRAKDEILGQVAYENFNFGYNSDTALRETLKLFTSYYGYKNASAVYDISLDDIKRELASGNLVIIPAAGAMLNNPYYAKPPPYHMLVVRGYDEVAQEFIVNDPGTRRGESYRYPYETIWKAIHDWTGDEAALLEGRKGMIVVRPETR